MCSLGAVHNDCAAVVASRSSAGATFGLEWRLMTNSLPGMAGMRPLESAVKPAWRTKAVS